MYLIKEMTISTQSVHTQSAKFMSCILTINKLNTQTPHLLIIYLLIIFII